MLSSSLLPGVARAKSVSQRDESDSWRFRKLLYRTNCTESPVPMSSSGRPWNLDAVKQKCSLLTFLVSYTLHWPQTVVTKRLFRSSWDFNLSAVRHLCLYYSFLDPSGSSIPFGLESHTPRKLQVKLESNVSWHCPVDFLISICSHEGFLALLLLIALFMRHIRGSFSNMH